MVWKARSSEAKTMICLHKQLRYMNLGDVNTFLAKMLAQRCGVDFFDLDHIKLKLHLFWNFWVGGVQAR